MTASLEYTGERYMPCVTGQFKYEHLHRYALALPFVTGKSVLDIASGEGYGSALLAQAARSVTGVDIDAQTVEHARAQYAQHANLQFREGTCAAIPLPDQSVDVVVSFETLEHHDQHEEMMAEVKRVLTPGGVLLISSPNRLVYSDLPQVKNPYHVKELYFDEFDELLRRYFRHHQMYGQRLAVGSFVYELQQGAATCLNVYGGNDQALRQQVTPLEDTVYFLAVCSDIAAHTAPTIQSLFVEPAEDVLKQLREQHEQERRDWLRDWEQLNNSLLQITNSRAYQFVQFIWRWRVRLSLGRGSHGV
jgi:2-polyprenyl-3-methyl-5-hydroxy-6-metoxy-1,4-benzoquinol methylase